MVKVLHTIAQGGLCGQFNAIPQKNICELLLIGQAAEVMGANLIFKEI